MKRSIKQIALTAALLLTLGVATTFAANTTHTSLFWLLPDYQLVYSAIIMIVRTRMEGGHLRMNK